ncbi:unnamed protein product [Calypogeia fissa]
MVEVILVWSLLLLASLTCSVTAARFGVSIGSHGGNLNSWSKATSTRLPSPPSSTRSMIKTNRPVIGIVTLPVTLEEEMVFGAQSFATSYVRLLQAGGARVAPIFYDSTTEELEAILSKVNGVVWTGSLVEFNPSDDEPEGFKYRRTTEFILEYVIRENEKGNHYPLWGTCLGFERLMELLVATENDETVLESTDAVDFGTNLDLTSYGVRSRLFKNLSRELLNEVTQPEGNIVYNNHELGVRPAAILRDPWVDSSIQIVSTTRDRNGKEFISSVEGTLMPLYGSQWHPEKSPWEWNTKLHPSHSTTAIEFSNYVGRFFVEECKYNGNSFADEEEESKALIQNWFSYPTGNCSVFSEVYFFWSPHEDARPSPNIVSPLPVGHPILSKLLSVIL